MGARQLFLGLFEREAKPLPEEVDQPATPTVPPPTRKDGNDPALTHTASRLAKKAGLNKLSGTVKVVWNTRLTTTAGRASYSNTTIELNPALQSLPEAIDEIERTLLHELAHLIAHARTKKGRRISAHGPEWRQACIDLGIPDESRCHTLDLAPRRRIAKKYAYQCPACRQVVLRVKKFSRYSACYPCCRRYNRGRYDRRFRLTPIPLDEAQRFLETIQNGDSPTSF